MAHKTITLIGVGEIMLVKRRGSRSIRLSVSEGRVRVSLPSWSPYLAGEAFARSHTAWIERALAKQQNTTLQAGQKIGKLHFIRFEQAPPDGPVTARVTGTEIIVRLQSGENITDAVVQERAYKACIRALRREASQLLPPRLKTLAERHNKHYISVSVKQLKRRWGSCDTHQAIVLNLFLMELPWDYIDYVIAHELAHTEQMNHGLDFWKAVIAIDPRARDLASQLRKRQPTIGPGQICDL